MADSGWEAILDRARGEVRDGIALSELLDACDEDDRQALSRLSLVVLRPDALAAGQGPALINHLAGLGAKPVAVRVLELTPALVDAAYHRQPKIPRDHVWIHTAALGAGAAAALLVAGEPGLTERLYASKGPSSTLRAAPPASVRSVFGRSSATHAVVHIPEDLAAFVAEATLLFPWEIVTSPPDPLPKGIATDLATLEPLPGRLVFQGVLKVKRRVAAALAARRPDSDAVRALRERTVAADAALDGLDFLPQRERMLAFATEERPLLEAVIAECEAALGAPVAPTRGAAWRALTVGTGAVELAYAAWFLTGHEAWGGDGGERLFAALAANDVPLSERQRTLVAAGLAHDLHPGARYDGERAWPLEEDPGGSFG